MEQDRTPVVFVYQPELARETIDKSCDHSESDSGNKNDSRIKCAL